MLAPAAPSYTVQGSTHAPATKKAPPPRGDGARMPHERGDQSASEFEQFVLPVVPALQTWYVAVARVLVSR